MYITGKADPLNLIEGGVPKLATGAYDRVRAKPKPPVRDSILKWAKALDCPMTPATVSEVNGVRTETYGPGRNGAEVVYITVDGLGHTWAGGRSLLPESMVGATSDRINATDVIWDFFWKHPSSLKDDDPSQQNAPADANKPRRRPFTCVLGMAENWPGESARTGSSQSHAIRVRQTLIGFEVRNIRELRKPGVPRDLAWNAAKSAHGPWRLSRSPGLARAMFAKYFVA